MTSVAKRIEVDRHSICRSTLTSNSASSMKSVSSVLTLAVAALILLATESQPVRPAVEDPFDFFRPSLVLDASERRRMDGGEVVVRTLPGHGHEVTVFAASVLRADPEALVHWTRAIAALKKSAFVIGTRRFSEPPVLDDLDALTLDPSDVEALRTCEEGDCPVKLAAGEIARLRAVGRAPGPETNAAVQQAFRTVVLARLYRYRAEGLQGLPPYVDSSKPVLPAEAFGALLARSPYIARNAPSLADWLERFPQVECPDVESFFYWSKEHFGAGKRVISVTHVAIVRVNDRLRSPAVIVVGKQIFATHYFDSGISLTVVLRGSPDGPNYLAYVNRSDLDILGGVFSGLKRAIIERRVRRDAPRILEGVRKRLESAPPSVTAASRRSMLHLRPGS